MTNIYNANNPLDLERLQNNIDSWINDVPAEALRLLMDSIEVRIGRERSGPAKKRDVPVDTGELAASLETTIGSAKVYHGQQGYILGLQTMNAEEPVTFYWTAEHASAVHWGDKNTPGYYWIEVGPRWDGFVQQAADKLALKHQVF